MTTSQGNKMNIVEQVSKATGVDEQIVNRVIDSYQTFIQAPVVTVSDEMVELLQASSKELNRLHNLQLWDGEPSEPNIEIADRCDALVKNLSTQPTSADQAESLLCQKYKRLKF